MEIHFATQKLQKLCNGDRKGMLAFDLEHPLRLVFQPDHEALPVKSDGGLDWARVTRILFLEIVDYH